MDAVRLVLTALTDVHDRLWDGDAALVRMPAGVAPGVDLSGRHSVRESALGAFLDLRRGATDRAVATLAAVLDHQYRASGRPWDGTFTVSAEDRIEDGRAVDTVQEWFDYDPNWRQFLGCTLALIEEVFGDALPVALRERIRDSVVYAARSEPRERLAVWYTNPYLMQAWLAGWAARYAGAGDQADELVHEAVARVGVVEERFARYGDVDEYNSPTYDAIDLFALALWVRLPPRPSFSRLGREMISALGRRISTLYHPGLAALCGPYTRAYGLGLDRYVSLSGLWLLLAGADRRVLPGALDEATDHVHDLYFLPLFVELLSVVAPELGLRDVVEARRHVQTFGGITASSLLQPGSALGAESGRVPRFAKEQYVPLTVHVGGPGRCEFLGMCCGRGTEAVDAELDEGTGVAFRARAADKQDLSVVLVTSAPPEAGPEGVRAGPVSSSFSQPPTAVETRGAGSRGYRTRLTWPAGRIDGMISV